MRALDDAGRRRVRLRLDAHGRCAFCATVRRTSAKERRRGLRAGRVRASGACAAKRPCSPAATPSSPTFAPELPATQQGGARRYAVEVADARVRQCRSCKNGDGIPEARASRAVRSCPGSHARRACLSGHCRVTSRLLSVSTLSKWRARWMPVVVTRSPARAPESLSGRRQPRRPTRALHGRVCSRRRSIRSSENMRGDRSDRMLGARRLRSPRRDIRGHHREPLAARIRARPHRPRGRGLEHQARPEVVGRQRYGNIAIANSDAAADAYTHAAIDQAWRAVNELQRAELITE